MNKELLKRLRNTPRMEQGGEPHFSLAAIKGIIGDEILKELTVKMRKLLVDTAMLMDGEDNYGFFEHNDAINQCIKVANSTITELKSIDWNDEKTTKE